MNLPVRPSLTRSFFRYSALLAVAVACRGGEKAGDSPPHAKVAAGVSDGSTEGALTVLGPPGVAEVPRSSDPDERAVETRLFQSDAGRVVLKAIRTQGGWKTWKETRAVRATVRGAAPEPLAGAGSGSASAAPPPAAKRIEVRPASAVSTAGLDHSAAILTAPFWIADARWRLEYLGVEADSAAGVSFYKVRVSQEEPSSWWCIAYVSQRSWHLERLVCPDVPGANAAGPSPGFLRVDFSGFEEKGGLRLPTYWKTYALRDRYARARAENLRRVETVDVDVESAEKPVPKPTGS